MTFGVVTVVPEAPAMGNLALDLDVWLEMEPPHAFNGYNGVYRRVSDDLGPQFAVRLRAPVFRRGELLVLDADGRDQFGRDPGKWDVAIERYEAIEPALARLARLALQSEPAANPR